ncbi:hypothetical protein ACFL6I_15520 [candidate division KSB1 bacterium]
MVTSQSSIYFLIALLMTDRRKTGEFWLRENDPDHTSPDKDDALSQKGKRIDVNVDSDSYLTTELNETVFDANGNFAGSEAPILPDDRLEDVMHEEGLYNHQAPRQTNEIPADNTTPETLAALIEDADGKVRTALESPEEFDDGEES